MATREDEVALLRNQLELKSAELDEEVGFYKRKIELKKREIVLLKKMEEDMKTQLKKKDEDWKSFIQAKEDAKGKLAAILKVINPQDSEVKTEYMEHIEPSGASEDPKTEYGASEDPSTGVKREAEALEQEGGAE